MRRLDDPGLVAREYASLDRLERRRLDRTAWLRQAGEPIETVLRSIGVAHPRRVLDAGCGTAEVAALLTAPEVVCVDASPAAVDAARSRGLEAVQGDIQRLPFADATFDVVMGNWTLYHLPDLDAGLAEIVRVLRPSGRLVGAYNRSGHLAELWTAVGCDWPPDSFDGENGAPALRRHFAEVKRLDTDGDVMWENREAMAAYLDAFQDLAGDLRPPEAPYPFRASRRNCVFVAVRPS